MLLFLDSGPNSSFKQGVVLIVEVLLWQVLKTGELGAVVVNDLFSLLSTLVINRNEECVSEEHPDETFKEFVQA
jgi:hypothetical protein